MNFIRSHNSQKNLTSVEQKAFDMNSKEDIKKRYQIMKLYTSRNNDSKSLVKNLSKLHQKSQENMQLKYFTNTNNSFRNRQQSPSEKYSAFSSELAKSSQNQSNQLNYQSQKADQHLSNMSSPTNKNLFPDFKNVYQLEDKDRYESSKGGLKYMNLTQKNLNRGINSEFFNKKINSIASGSQNFKNQYNQSKEDMKESQFTQAFFNAQRLNALKQTIPSFEKNTHHIFPSTLSNKSNDKQINFSNPIANYTCNPINSIQKQTESSKILKNQTNFFAPTQQQNGFGIQKKADKSFDMSSSHNSINYQNQVSPSSRSGYNYIKETLTTQESNFGSDPIICDSGRSKEILQYKKKNPIKQSEIRANRLNQKVNKETFQKCNQISDENEMNNSVKFQNEGDDYQNKKNNFFQNINQIMRKQSMMMKQKKEKANKIQNKENNSSGEIKISKTEINLLKKKMVGKKLGDMSPNSQIKFSNLIKLKAKARHIHQNITNSFSSNVEKSFDDEVLSLNSDSILTDELDNIDLYKKRLKASQVKFHKMHLKRLNKPMGKSQEQLDSNQGNEFLDYLFNDGSPIKSKKKVNMDLKSKPENYNIFGQYNDFSRQLQQKFKNTVHRLRPSRDVLKYVEVESKKIHHKITTMNAEKNIEMHKMSYRNLAETSINAIQKMIPIFEEGIKQITDRNAVDDALTKIYQESLKTKNLVIQILCAQAHAKISKLNKNFAKSIELYKICKNSAEIPMLFNYRMNCYKNLGHCFSNLKMHEFAMFYFGKMLRIAWYQNNRDAELKAYDLIGMQYYYQGKLEVAQYYHNKMLCAEYENDSSDMRRLGISKIDNVLKRIEDGYAGHASGAASSHIIPGVQQKKLKLKLQNQDPDQSCDFNISSESEEDFELPIPSKSYQQQSLKENNQANNINNIETLDEETDDRFAIDNEMDDSREIDRNNLLKLSMKQRKFKKNQPLFYHKDTYQLKQITDQANKNIYIGAVERNKKLVVILPKKQINASSFKQIKGCTKIPYRINHLSVNRELDNYQCIDARVTRLKHFNFNEQMYDQYEKNIKQSVKVIFENLRDNLLFSMAQLEMLIQKQKSPTKRKAGFSLIPYQGKDQPNDNNDNLIQPSYTITLAKDSQQL